MHGYVRQLQSSQQHRHRHAANDPAEHAYPAGPDDIAESLFSYCHDHFGKDIDQRNIEAGLGRLIEESVRSRTALADELRGEFRLLARTIASSRSATPGDH